MFFCLLPVPSARGAHRAAEFFFQPTSDTIVKYSGVQLAIGRARRVNLKELTATEALEALKAHLQNLTSSQAIGLTAAKNGQVENAIITRDQEADWEEKGKSKPDHIARTIANFPWPDGAGFLLC